MSLFALSGAVLFSTGIILLVIILMSRKSQLHYTWGMFNVAVIIWGASVFFIGRSEDYVFSQVWWKIAHIGIILIPVFFYHVIHLLCELSNKKTLIFIYLQGAVFLLLNLLGKEGMFISKMRFVFESFYFFTPGYLYNLFLTCWLTIVFYGIATLFITFRKSSGIRRNQLALFLIGITAGFSGGLTNFFPAYGLDLYPYGNFGYSFYCIIATYSIMRYRLMDIKLVIKKSMVYSLSAGILTSLFVVLVLAMTKYLSEMAGISSFAIMVIAALIIAVLFTPLKIRIQSIVDRVFYKKSYDYYATIQQVSSTLSSMFDKQSILKFIGNVISEVMGLKSIYVLSAESGGEFEVVYNNLIKQHVKEEGNETGLLLNDDSAIVRVCKTSKDIIIKDELNTILAGKQHDMVRDMVSNFDLFHGEAIAPVFIDGKLSLLIVMGEKMSGDMFSSEDINLLKTITEQMSIAVKNAQFYRDNVQTERLASIGMMSATFAHEIRNPLTSLKTFAQLMPEKYNDVEFRETFSKIVEGEIEKIDGLIRDLLDFSVEKQSARINNFDIVELVDESVDYVKSKIDFERNNIKVEKDYSESEIDMSGDATKLTQAFVNIITNGCQAMNGDGKLTIKIVRNSETVSIAIKDNGEGIAPEGITKIFDPFVTSKQMGVGLGLAISRRVVDDHEGTIEVESKLTEGTTFTILLPVKK